VNRGISLIFGKHIEKRLFFITSQYPVNAIKCIYVSLVSLADDVADDHDISFLFFFFFFFCIKLSFLINENSETKQEKTKKSFEITSHINYTNKCLYSYSAVGKIRIIITVVGSRFLMEKDLDRTENQIIVQQVIK
jgi:hypothetical protein